MTAQVKFSPLPSDLKESKMIEFLDRLTRHLSDTCGVSKVSPLLYLNDEKDGLNSDGGH